MRKIQILKPSALAIAISMALPATHSIAARPTSGAYVTDPQSEYVNDLATEAISGADQILCFMSNTRADSQVNAGRYVALIDESACDTSGRASADNSNSSGGSSGSIKYTRMSLTSTRASNTSAQIVKGHAEVQSGTVPVYFYASVSEAASATAPNGVLTFDFSGISNAVNVMRGRITAQATTLTYQEVGNQGGAYNIRLYLTGNSTSGSGVVRNSQPGQADKTITFGYNATHFCRSNGVTEGCFLRAKTDAKSSVWRYGVYDDDTGARYDLAQPGFMIKKDGVYGYASYWGVWFPTTLADGATVTNDSGTTSYTVKTAEGRLIKRSKEEINKSAAEKIPFQFFVNTTAAVTGGNLTAGTTYETWWNGSEFVISAKMGTAGREVLSPNLTATPAQINTATGGFGMRGYAPAASAEVYVPSTTLTGATSTFTLTRESTVQPGDTTVPASLTCVKDCPTAAMVRLFRTGDRSYTDPTSIGYLANPGAPFTAGTRNRFGNTLLADKVTYTWSPTNYTLQGPVDNGSVAGSAAAQGFLQSTNLPSKSTLESTFFRFGVRSGALVDSTNVGSGAALDCDGAGVGTTQCEFKVGALTEYYIWEMGRQPHNTPVFLQKSDNTYVAFTAPQNATFAVPANNAGSTEPYGDFAGANMTLNFQGFGQLQGIPGKCFSTQTNAEVNCGPNTRYVPAFSIPYGVDGKVTIGTATKWIKWLDRELRFSRVPGATSAGLGITMGSAADLPAAINSGDTNDPAVSSNTSIYPGDYATTLFESKPKVIHGVVQ